METKLRSSGRITRSSTSRVTTAITGTRPPSTPTYQGRPRQASTTASSLPSPSLSPETPAKTRMPTPPPSSRLDGASLVVNFSESGSTGSTSSLSSRRSSNSNRASLPPPPPAPTPDTAVLGSSKDGTGMPSPPHHEQSFFAQNRAILLSGLPQGGPDAALPSVESSSSPTSRLGRNARKTAVDRLAPLVTRGRAGPASDALYSPSMQSPRVVSACIYVKAVGFDSQGEPTPRSSSASEDSDASVKKEDDPARLRKQSIVSMASSTFASTVSVPTLEPGQLYICAFVRPSSADKKPYAIRRVCDREELARSVPKPDGRAASSVSILPSPLLPPQSPFFHSTCPSPSSAGHPHPGHATATEGRRQSLGPGAGIKRRTSPSPLSPESPMPPNLRRHSHLLHHRRQSNAMESSSPDQFLTGDGIPIPMRPHPALGMLPGLAAVVLSGRIHAGDLIEQPLPHPEAWPATVSYVYKGCGEATEAVKQNIEHLGGKLEL